MGTNNEMPDSFDSREEDKNEKDFEQSSPTYTIEETETPIRVHPDLDKDIDSWQKYPKDKQVLASKIEENNDNLNLLSSLLEQKKSLEDEIKLLKSQLQRAENEAGELKIASEDAINGIFDTVRSWFGSASDDSAVMRHNKKALEVTGLKNKLKERQSLLKNISSRLEEVKKG